MGHYSYPFAANGKENPNVPTVDIGHTLRVYILGLLQVHGASVHVILFTCRSHPPTSETRHGFYITVGTTRTALIAS